MAGWWVYAWRDGVYAWQNCGYRHIGMMCMHGRMVGIFMAGGVYAWRDGVYACMAG